MENGTLEARISRIEQRLHDIRDILAAFADAQGLLIRLETKFDNVKEDVREGAEKFDALERRLEADRIHGEERRREARKERQAAWRWQVGIIIAACACLASVVAVIVSVVS